MQSSGSYLFKNPELTVKNLSLTLPPQAGEVKVVTPCGHIAMKTLAVFECLYWDHVDAFATRWLGVSILIS